MEAKLDECLVLFGDHIIQNPQDNSYYHRELMELLLEQDFTSDEEEEWFYFSNILMTIVVIVCVAIFAGLFVGLMTMDAFQLQITERSSLDEDERKYAATLYPVVADRHRLLVTLLILNALSYETLPLFLDKMVPAWLAIVLSTTFVLLFGEIVPSAIFIGPQQLQLVYHLIPFIKVLLFLLYPIAKPGALLLDYLVHGPEGEDEMQEEYNRDELSALVNLQYEQRQNLSEIQKLGGKSNNNKTYPVRLISRWTAMKHEMLEAVSERFAVEIAEEEETPQFASELTAPMEKQEVDVVVGALQMKTRVATDVFTPRSQVYCIPDDLILDREGTIKIYAKGYSRVPVYFNEVGRDEDINESCIIGFLMTRQLMLIDWDHEREVSTLPLVRPHCVSPRRNLVDLLRLLRSGGSLMAFVCARPDLGNRALMASQPLPVEAGYIGIITLEDILESILQERIYDERDIKDRDRAMATLTKWAAEKLTNFIRRSVAKRRFSLGHDSLSGGDGQVTSPLTERTPLLRSSSR